MDEALIRVCGVNTSDFSNTDSIEEKIQIMKREGKVYSRESFYQLLNIINIENIVVIDFSPVILSSRLQVENLLNNEVLKRNTSETSLEKVMHWLKEIFDSYDSTVGENDERIEKASTYLSEEINRMMNVNILPFINRHSKSEKTQEFIRNIEKLKTRGNNIYLSREDETAFAEMRFLKQAVYNILKIFPSIIINHVDYGNLKIPKHWNLASSHAKDIKHIISKEFHPIARFYEDKQLNEFLGHILTAGDDMIEIMEATPFYANIRKEPDAPRIPTLLNGKLLEKFMKFYFLYAINIYLEVLEEKMDEIGGKIISTSGASIGQDTLESIARGEQDTFRERIGKLLLAYIKILMSGKNILNISDK